MGAAYSNDHDYNTLLGGKSTENEVQSRVLRRPLDCWKLQESPIVTTCEIEAVITDLSLMVATGSNHGEGFKAAKVFSRFGS